MDFNDVLYVLLTVAVPVLFKYIHQLVSTLVEGSKYEEAVDTVLAAVDYVNQTFVDSLKQSGNFDRSAQLEAIERAKDAALFSLSASTTKWLEKTYIDLDGWLTIQIESAVRSQKGVV